MNEALIDVIIPVYNGAAYISEAIASIQAQTWHNLTIIVVDDGSEDDTASVVEKLALSDKRITLYKRKHSGVSSAINYALSVATANYVSFLDADDLWLPQKLEQQFKCLTENKVAICFCLLQEFESDNETEIGQQFKARPNPLKGYSKTTFLGNKSVFEKYGLFNEDIATGDFIEWFSRALRAEEPFVMIDEVFSARRIHNSNTTRGVNKNAFLHILKTHLNEVRKSS